MPFRWDDDLRRAHRASCPATAATPTSAGSTSSRATCSTPSTPTTTSRAASIVDVVRYPHLWRDDWTASTPATPAPLDDRPRRRHGDARSRSTTGRSSSRASTSAGSACRHRYGYASTAGTGVDGFAARGTWCKYDLRAGAPAMHASAPGAPRARAVFVPGSRRPPARTTAGCSAYVYDAAHRRQRPRDPRRRRLHRPRRWPRWRSPQRVPFGFHGSWVADTEL